MRTVQMTLDEELIEQVDQLIKRLGTTRSAFTRDALRSALAAARVREMEHRQREGYRKKPVAPGEFSDWEVEQVWV